MTAGLFRWRAIVPLTLVVILVGAAVWLFLDPTVERSVERFGTEIVGARVDLEAADVRLGDGVIYLRGLAVTNPDRPMTNLFEADEIVANFRVTPLFEKKVVIDTVALRGLRFGTARETSGAVARPSRTSREIRREITTWRERLRLPEFSVAGLGRVVNLEAVRADSLATLRAARAFAARTDSVRTAWTRRIDQLNPRPAIDSARGLVTRLEGASVRSLGLTGVRDAVSSARSTLTALARVDDALADLERGVTGELAQVGTSLQAVDRARQEDYAYARGLLALPSLDGPGLGPSIFGGAVADQIAPYLYWLAQAERFMPPGVRARLREGKDRARGTGTSVVFPRRENLPRFLLGLAEATVAIGGAGAAAGNYELRITDLTSAPTLLGRPATLLLGRTEGRRGPETVRVGGILNHVSRPIHDSVDALVGGISLPTLRLTPLGATLDMGRGTTELTVQRTGDSLAARWKWTSRDVRWDRLTGAPADTTGRLPDPSARGVGRALAGSAESTLWRAISRVDRVEIEARLTGSVSSPRLAVGSNVAQALAAALRQEVGAEVRRYEQMARARVDSLVAEQLTRANQAVDGFRTQANDRIAARRREIRQVRAELEARIRDLTRGIPGIGMGEPSNGRVGNAKGRA